jgi:glycerophosphoryl diester phosphodiesterase
MPPLVIAHRGASGYAFENSMAAFQRAVELGADAVELDIHAAADGVLLVHHDAKVPGVGAIADLPATAFASHRLPNGEAIPTLPQALDALRGLDVWVEVKTLPPAADQRLFDALNGGPTPKRYAVHAFDHRIIARLGEEQPTLRRGVLLASYLLDALPILHGVGADTLWMETDLIDAALVSDLHDDGMAIIAWTANDDAEIRRLIGLGVDGICGNFPDRIRAAIG